tara:strand:- start:9355 stop:12954 length:3600 start_codon:yes stop_codon:yes gene_type:complete
MRKSFTVPASMINDNRALEVLVSNSSLVTASCSTRRVTVRISYTETPDLLMSSISVPNTTGYGSTLTVTYNVRNRSTRAAGQFIVGFYYKDNSVFSGAQLLGSATIASLGANTTTGNRTINLTLPNTVTAGTRYIHYFIDRTNVIAEGIESNNKGSKAFSITGKPNLRARLLTVSPTSGFPGTNVTLRYRIDNSGTTRASSPFFIGFYFSNDSTITTSDTFLKAVTRNSLNAKAYYPGSTTTASITVTIPSNAPIGSRYLGMFVDYAGNISETTTGDNKRSTAFTVVAPKPNLRMRSISVPNARGFGSSVNVSFNVENNGNGDSGRFIVRFYYGAGTGTTGLTALGDYTINSLPKGSNTGTLTRTLVLPNTVVAGRRYIHYFIDYLNDIAETTESDNRSSKAFNVTGQPDLQVVFLNRSVSSAFPGSQVTLTYRLYNAGYTRMPKSTVVGFYFSNNGTIELTDSRLAQATVPILNARTYRPASGTLSINVTLPASAAAGSRFLGAYVNDKNPITEASTTNNTRAVPINVVARQSDLLAVRVVSQNATPEAGKTFKLDYEVKNIGNTTLTSYTVHLYFSTDTSITTSDTRLASFTRSNLAPNATHKGTRTLTIPASAKEGVAYIGMFLDPANAIKEGDETNNKTLTFVNVRVDNDGDGVTADKDCNDKDKTVYPGAKEVCDGKDNNCDKLVDEGCPCVSGTKRSCYNLGSGCVQQSNGSFKCSGPCKVGSQTCNAGVWSACAGAVGPKAETCDKVDNDCDGNIDDNLKRSCYTGPSGTDNLGICQQGSQTCAAGKWGTCSGETLPAKESCNNKDDDCDGSIDEQLTRACYNGPSGTRKQGECLDGLETCVQGAWGTCQGEVQPAKEVCNNKDDDCDGKIDESISRACYSGRTITKGVGECKEGTETCQAGAWSACKNEVLPQSETCNQKDDDCDGQVDNGTCKEPDPEPQPEPKPEPVVDASEPMPEPEPVVEQIAEVDCYANGCPGGKICLKGQCVDDPCEGKTCGDGEFCRGGDCVKVCGCVQCADKEFCEDGACKPKPCDGKCTAGQKCENDTCVEDGCATIKCGAGTVCVEGQCIDDPCANVKCPGDMTCALGQCVGGTCSEPVTEPTAEPAAEPNVESSVEPSPEPKTEPAPDAAPDQVVSDRIVGGDNNGTNDKTGRGPGDQGCGCSTSSISIPQTFMWFMFALFFFVRIRRRR